MLSLQQNSIETSTVVRAKRAYDLRIVFTGSPKSAKLVTMPSGPGKPGFVRAALKPCASAIKAAPSGQRLFYGWRYGQSRANVKAGTHSSSVAVTTAVAVAEDARAAKARRAIYVHIVGFLLGKSV